MILAIGIWDDYTWSTKINSRDPKHVTLALFNAFENGCGHYPKQVLLVQDDKIVGKYYLGKDY